MTNASYKFWLYETYTVSEEHDPGIPAHDRSVDKFDVDLPVHPLHPHLHVNKHLSN